MNFNLKHSMNIDRHNYEEFFILYLDNELNDSDRRQVEEFAQANPDLQEELNILLQSKFTPDMDIVLENKDALIREADMKDEINMANYEEWLLLYTDNELERDSRKKVEKFIATHPAIAQELSLFHQAKLEADSSIVFPDKELLYHRETKVRSISFRRMRVAAAAVLLLGMSASVYMLMEQKREKAGGIAKTTDVNSAVGKSDTPAQLAITNRNETKIADQNIADTDINANMTSGSTETEVHASVVPVNKMKAESNNELIAVNLPTTADRIENIRSTTEVSELNSLAGEKSIAASNALTTSQQNNPVPVVTPEDTRPSYFQTPEPITEEDLAGVNQSGKKNKFRGFFRKVTRTFEKTTNIKATDDEDRLLVAGLAIKL